MLSLCARDCCSRAHPHTLIPQVKVQRLCAGVSLDVSESTRSRWCFCPVLPRRARLILLLRVPSSVSPCAVSCHRNLGNTGVLKVASKAQVRCEQIPVHLSPPASAALLLHQHVCRLAIVAVRLDVSRN